MKRKKFQIKTFQSLPSNIFLRKLRLPVFFPFKFCAVLSLIRDFSGLYEHQSISLKQENWQRTTQGCLLTGNVCSFVL